MRPDSLTIGIELINDPTWMGGTLYLKNLAVALARLPKDERPGLQLLGAQAVVEQFVRESPELSCAQHASNTLPARILQKLGLIKQGAPRPDVVYPGFGPSIPGTVTVRWIPDFQHRYLPQLFSAEERSARDQAIGELANQAGVVVLSSHVAEADFKHFYPDARAKTRVWQFCSLLDTTRAADASVLQRYDLPDKYLYLPNQFWLHKNHLTVLKALEILNKRYSQRVPLVCTGATLDPRNPDHYTEVQAFIAQSGLYEQVFLLGLIDRKDQVEVLRHATAVIQPSLFEGWSTVVEDVRAIGRPIFLSDLPVHREQAPDRCQYFEPTNDEGLAALLAESWPLLPKGPDAKHETRARVQMQARIEASARNFVSIAQTARQAGYAP